MCFGSWAGEQGDYEERSEGAHGQVAQLGGCAVDSGLGYLGGKEMVEIVNSGGRVAEQGRGSRGGGQWEPGLGKDLAGGNEPWNREWMSNRKTKRFSGSKKTARGWGK